MLQPGRQYTAGTGYRYGFNGKENDNEIKGEGNQQDYGMRIYDPRLGKFLSLDPIAGEYPELSPYQFSHNSPVFLIDLDGAEGAYRAPDGTIHLNTYGPSDNLRTPPIPSNSTPLWGFHRGIGADAMHKIAEGLSLLLDYVPILGNIKGALEGIFGYDIAGNKLSPEERSLSLIPYLKSPKKLSALMSVAKATDKTDEVNDLIKRANKIEDAKVTSNAILNETDKGVLFSADLSKTRAKSRSGHRNAGNKQLNEAMKNDPDLKKQIEEIDLDAITNTSTSNGGRRNPRLTEWDHNSKDPNKLDLRTKENHRQKTAKDPGRKGGWSIFHKQKK